MLPLGPAAATAPLPDPPAQTLFYAEVVLNGQSAGTFMLVRRDGRFFMRPDALRDLAIAVPPGAALRIEAEDFVPLGALPGAAIRFDEGRQELQLDIAAAAFTGTRLSAAPRSPRPSKSARAVFVNYDLNIEADRQVAAGGAIEAGVSDDWGLAVTSLTVGRSAGGQGVTRLDTFVVRDNPERLTRLAVGDTLTAPVGGLPQARFGGVRFGTAFDLRPGFITFPTPAFAGQTAIPSQVELLVNGALQYRADVSRGPFAIEQVPVATGAGQATLVIRDVLGVERTVISSYYAAPDLLRRGLSEWSVEAGVPRLDYGIESFSYGAPFVAAGYRTGLTDAATVDSRVELSSDIRMASGGVAWVLPAVGEFGVAGGVSDSEDGIGAFYALSFRRVTRVWSLAAGYRRATTGFVSLGAGPAIDRLTGQAQVSAGLSLGHRGNVSLAYSALDYAGDRQASLATASYSINVGARGYLNAFAMRTTSQGRPAETTSGVAFSLSLGQRTSGFVQADTRGIRGEVRRAPDYGGGFGYRLAASGEHGDREQAELSWRGAAADMRVEAARAGDDMAVRAQIGGGLLLAGGRIAATRRIEEGMAVVDVGDHAGVRIYQDNRLVARTDAHGRAIVPNLHPYQENRISLAAADLPLGTAMAHDAVVVVPRFRGAARADFDTGTATPVTVIVEQPDGTLLEPGSGVAMADGSSTFAGFGGEVFVRDATPGLTIRADTAAGPCTVTLPREQALTALARIGPVRCRVGSTAS